MDSADADVVEVLTLR